jgi:hypothetical protein
MSEQKIGEPSAFEYEGRSIGYVIRPGRCRFVKIVVTSADEVEVRVPPRVSAKSVQAFVEQQAEWIMQAMAKQAKKPRLAPLKYATGETLFYLGKPYRLEVTRAVWKSVTREEGVLRVALYNKANPARVKALVDDWFRQQAQALLAKYLSETLQKFGERIRHARCPLALRSEEETKGLHLTVRAMKTRWGSCSKDGHISLSVELIHAPRRLIEYVIVHELCHLVHLDHSPAFYFQLARCLPDWEERRRELEARSWRQAQVPR